MSRTYLKYRIALRLKDTQFAKRILYIALYSLLGGHGQIDNHNWYLGGWRWLNVLPRSIQKRWYDFEWRFLHRPLNFIFAPTLNYLEK